MTDDAKTKAINEAISHIQHKLLLTDLEEADERKALEGVWDAALKEADNIIYNAVVKIPVSVNKMSVYSRVLETWRDVAKELKRLRGEM